MQQSKLNVRGTQVDGGATSGPDRSGEPPRIVLYFVAYPQRMAGASRSLFELVTNLPPEIVPLVVVAGEGRVAQAYRDAGVPCLVLEPSGLLNEFGKRAVTASLPSKLRAGLVDLPRYTLRLAEVIRARGVHLIHANGPREAVLIAAAARLTGRPLVTHVRGELPFGKWMRRFIGRAGDRIITVSDAVRWSLSAHAQAKATTVYNGIRAIEPSERRIAWLEELRGRGVLVVGCFASIVPFKGHHHLIRAAALLNARGWRDRVLFLCVGDLVEEHREYAQWLWRLCDSLGVDNLCLTGWQDDPFAFYRYVDLSVLPSVSQERLQMNGAEVEVLGNEGFPRTHLEAMCLGIPVVGTAIAGVPEQVADGITGRVVPPGDPVSLADAIEEILRSAEMREEMGQNARTRVARLFSTEVYVQGVVSTYRDLTPAVRS